MDELSAYAATATTAGALFYPMASARCSDDDLRRIRMKLVALAEDYGFPREVSRSDKTRFDRAAVGVLHDSMGILPADAACNEVWIFLNVRLLPDIMVWRYGSPGMGEADWRVSIDRIFTFNRSTFGRLWWRAQLLGTSQASQLAEDEAVQIVERPRIAGYPRLAAAIARRHIESTASSQRMELLRDVMKRLTRRLAVVSIFVMDESQIRLFVEEVFTESEEAMALANTS